LKSYPLTKQGINEFLANLKCGNGKHGYYRAIRAFCNWAAREGYIKENPVKVADAPKPRRQILPSLNIEQVDFLIEHSDSLRDKAIIAVLADSGMILNELAHVKASDINWDSNTIIIWGKVIKMRVQVLSFQQKGSHFTNRESGNCH
jgi:site-specific recombinase XerD